MKRLTRAITEIESFRSSVLRTVWKSPGEVVIIGLLNTAITALAQAQLLTPVSLRRDDIDMNPNRTSEMIAQINDEIRDEKVKTNDKSNLLSKSRRTG